MALQLRVGALRHLTTTSILATNCQPRWADEGVILLRVDVACIDNNMALCIEKGAMLFHAVVSMMSQFLIWTPTL